MLRGYFSGLVWHLKQLQWRPAPSRCIDRSSPPGRRCRGIAPPLPRNPRAVPRGLRPAVLPLRRHAHRQQALQPSAQGQHGHAGGSAAGVQELRGRTRVTIEHRDLPEPLKQIAAEAVRTIWQAANEAAPASWPRCAPRRAKRPAPPRPSAMRRAPRPRSRAEAAAIAAKLAEAGRALAENQVALTAERQAHAATQARLDAGRAELEAAGRQLAELCTQFSTELARARRPSLPGNGLRTASGARRTGRGAHRPPAERAHGRRAARRTGDRAERGARCGGGAGRGPRLARSAGRGADRPARNRRAGTAPVSQQPGGGGVGRGSAPGRAGRRRSGAGAPAAGRIAGGATRTRRWWRAAAQGRWPGAEREGRTE